MYKFLVVFSFVFLFACGKVAQDISEQSTKSIFESAALTMNINLFSDAEMWDTRFVTQNATDIYVYAQGLSFGKGYEKIGWAYASIGLEIISSKNIPTVSNYDDKKNTVTSSRYQQGFIKVAAIPTENYIISTEFKKVRPKYDYYSFVQYSSKNEFLFNIDDKIPTHNIVLTPYTHLVSTTFIKHLKKESYIKESVIPLKDFYLIIPTQSILASANVNLPNTVKKFNPNDPLFSVSSDYIEAILNVVNLSYHSEQFDVEDYITSLDEDVFSDDLKNSFIDSVKKYFGQKSSNVNTSPNSTELL